MLQLLQDKKVCIALSIIVLALTIYLTTKKSESYTLMYPFHPINPSTVQPWDEKDTRE